MMSQDCPCELTLLVHHVTEACLCHRFSRHLLCNLGLRLVRLIVRMLDQPSSRLDHFGIGKPSSCSPTPLLDLMLYQNTPRFATFGENPPLAQAQLHAWGGLASLVWSHEAIGALSFQVHTVIARQCEGAMIQRESTP